MSQVNNDFLKVSLEQIPRLLGQLNRNPSSKSYGSFDRAYWHYRTNDISCARYEEAVYTLALLYTSNFEGNIYYQDEKVLEWIRATLRFTISLQRSNGSFDEWYVNEGSYVATSFVSAALGQTIDVLRKNNIKIEEGGAVVSMLERSAHFLVQSQENTVLNQVSGAIFAIAMTGKLAHNKALSSQAEHLMSGFISKQSKEGWWSEYGGPDIGYLSLTISYLGKYLQINDSKEVREAISKAKSFLELFIHPDMSAGGEYMARNTEYLVPSSNLLYMGRVTPQTLDDRYLCYILYNWIETGLSASPQTFSPKISEKYFEESMVLRVSNSKYFIAANGMKGGSLRVYSEDKVYYDSGIEIRTPKGSYSSGILDVNNQVTFESGELKIKGSFKSIKEPLLKTGISIIFKSWQLVFGRVSFLQKFIKKFLRKGMISYSSQSQILFERVVKYGASQIVVRDTIYGAVSKDDIIFGVKSAYSAVPSSKYAAQPEISRGALKPRVVITEQADSCVIERTFDLK